MLTFLEPIMWIVGTTKTKNVDDNVGSLEVKFSKDDLKEITDAIPISEVAGYRMADIYVKCSWKFADTPPKA